MSQYDDDLDPLDDPESRPGGPPPLRRDRLKPNRGSTVLVLGILGLLLCVICGVVAWVMGASDLRDMREGRMERRGESETRTGMVLGIVSTCLGGLALLFGLLVLVGVIAVGDKVLSEGLKWEGFSRQAQRTSAEQTIGTLEDAITRYQKEQQRLPGDLDDLTLPPPGSAEPYLAHVPRDPWGRKYEYRRKGADGYLLRSWGPDGLPGTIDDVVAVGGPEGR